MRRDTPNVLSVNYCEQRPKVTTWEVLAYMVISSQGSDQFNFIEDDDVRDTFEKSIMTKSNDWQYEQEWRAMVIDEKLAGYRFAPGLTVKRLILGVNTPTDLEVTLVREFGEYVEIERAKLDEQHFTLSKYSMG